MGIRKVNFRAATGTSNAREVRNQNPFFTSIHTRSRLVQNQVYERKRDFQRHGDYGAATIRRRITLKSCARKTPVHAESGLPSHSSPNSSIGQGEKTALISPMLEISCIACADVVQQIHFPGT